MPNSFAQEPTLGLLFIADGVSSQGMIKWDGIATQAVSVGVAPPATALTLAIASDVGTLNGQYFAYVRFVDKDGNFSNLSPISNSVTANNNLTVNYTNVPVPTDPKITRRQILRNTAGQATTFYVDIDTTDITSTSFTSTNADTMLSTLTQVPILNSDGTLNANQYTVSPNWKSVIAYHLSRMFAAVDVEYTRGCCQVSTGSTAVTGIGTEWTTAMTNRFLYVLGAPTTYQIASVDPVGQVLTLTAPYAGPPDNYAAYCVRPPPAERRLIYYSQSGLPEAWPAVNALSLQEDGDEITGLMAKGSFLYILEKRHIYRFTFQSNPATDGFVFLSAQRGCINHRCWVQVEDMAYMLDELGVHAFSGGQECEPISGPVQDLFRPSDSTFKINWKASKWFHCAHNRVQETIRWFVSLSGDYLPRHAIVYDYRRKRWWIEAYPYPVGAAVVGYINGVPKLLLGADARRVFSLWEGVLDGPDPTAGTVRGTVTSSTMLTITDALANYAGSGLVNAPLSIVAGTGKNQVRRIVAVSGQTITVSEPWLIKPDTTSVYQIGGVQWQYWSGDFRFAQSENTTERRVEVVFSQTINPCAFDMHLYIDFAPTPLIWNMDNVLDDGRGFTPSVGSTDLVADMTKTAGFVQQRIDGHKDFYLDGARFLSVELVGFTNADSLSIYGLVIDGVAEG